MTRLERTLFLGDPRQREFREAWHWLVRHRRSLHRVASVDEACLWIRGHESPPDLLIVAQSRPGQFSQTDVERLHRAAPLSRLVALLGSWCEGESCSGEPWNGVVRMYWHEFISRLRRETAEPLAGDKSWELPRTATEAERLAQTCRPLARQHRGLILIGAARFVVFEGLAEACRQAGFAAAWLAPGRPCHVRGVHAGLWDDSSLQAEEPQGIPAMVKQIEPAPLVALLDFPRHTDWQAAVAAGANALHAKPCLLDEVLADLIRLTGSGNYRKSIPA